MKLYEVPKKTWIKLDGVIYFFDHIDGMYSYCKTQKGDVFHLASWVEVEIVQELKNEENI